jgi:hypothetical protein
MRLLSVVGILLILAGAFVLYSGGVLTSRRDVVKLGDLKVTAEEQHPIQPWIAGAAILGGVVLVVSGAKRRA